jgi:hypothetical protein
MIVQCFATSHVRATTNVATETASNDEKEKESDSVGREITRQADEL